MSDYEHVMQPFQIRSIKQFHQLGLVWGGFAQLRETIDLLHTRPIPFFCWLTLINKQQRLAIGKPPVPTWKPVLVVKDGLRWVIRLAPKSKHSVRRSQQRSIFARTPETYILANLQGATFLH